MNVEVRITATLPEALLLELLQHMRNFDLAHDACHFDIRAAAWGMTTEKMQAVLDQIDPPFPIRKVTKYEGNA